MVYSCRSMKQKIVENVGRKKFVDGIDEIYDDQNKPGNGMNREGMRQKKFV